MNTRTASDGIVELDKPMGSAKHNRLLSALTVADGQRWRMQMECVNLQRDQVLNEAGLPCRHVYFPTTAVVSLTCLLANGATAQVAIVGNEGLVGESILLHDGRTTSSSVVLIAGQALLRISEERDRPFRHRDRRIRERDRSFR